MEPTPIFTKVFSTFFLQSKQVYFIYDPEAKSFVFINQAFEQVWNLPITSVQQQPSLLIESIHNSDKQYIRELYQGILTEGKAKKDIEFKISTSGQEEKWICISVFVITADNGKCYLTGTAEDITDKKLYIDNLMKFGAKKNAVLEILSHDLAGPMNTMQGLAGLVASKVKPYQNKELDELIQLIIDSSKRNVKLIRDFVANEFLESSGIELSKQRLNIIERFKQVIEEYKNSENALAKTFEFHYSHDPLYMEIDDMKFTQVINNLFSNAIKFTPDNGTIVLRVEDRESTVLITVADNGIGIPQNLQASLFDKFTRARRPGLKGEDSTGLGMSIIKTIIEWHKGKIWFNSIENKGSTFYIELPKE